MILVNKFDYKPVPRKNENGQRKYLTPGGNKVPSVTTVLDRTKDKTHLYEWRKRVGEKRAQQITTEAASVGTRMHKYLENYVLSGEWGDPGSNPYSRKSHAMATLIKEEALCNVNEVWGSEVQLYCEQLYAGTTDLVGLYKGNPAIMDFKQSNKPKKEEWIEDYKLQLVAYAVAHNEMFDTDIKQAHVFIAVRGEDQLEPGNEQFQDFHVWPEDFDTWQNKWFDRLYEYYEKYH